MNKNTSFKIAIHHTPGSFSDRWILYCQERSILYKNVDVYSSSLIEELADCYALLWHFHQSNPRDILAAKNIIHAIQQSGISVFPDVNTAWHFDDKVAQKYLLAAIKAPLVPSYVFYNMELAKSWFENQKLPIVFKLKGGAGSANVKLVKTKRQGHLLIKKAFGKGFSPYDAFGSLKERWRKYRQGKVGIYEVMKGIARLLVPPPYVKIAGRERGYIYFQDFIPNNSFDIRIIVIDNKAFGLKRMVRENDFRASGSGSFKYEKAEFDERCVQIAFDISKKLKTQCLAYDFVFDINNNPLIVEISFGFSPEGYDDCPGYWDSSLTWHEGKFNPQGWMVDLVVKGE